MMKLYQVVCTNTNAPNGVTVDVIAGFEKKDVLKDVYFEKYLPEIRLKARKAQNELLKRFSFEDFCKKIEGNQMSQIKNLIFEYEESSLEGVA